MINCPKKIFIYKMIDPVTEQVRYIGKTVQKPKNRLSSHISQAKHNKKKDYCHCWIKSLLNRNINPIFEVIEETADIERETYWIKFYKEQGYNLTNFTDGGEMGNLGKTWKISPEAVERAKNNPKRSINTYIWDLEGNLIGEFNTTVLASNYMKNVLKENCSPSSIWLYNKKKKVYRSKYIFSFTKVFPTDYKRSNTNRSILYIKNNIEVVFRTAKEASFYLSIPYTSICHYAKSNKATNKEKQFTIKYIK